MISDPTFYLAALPAVFLVGMAKGGFGGSISLLGVPLMSLVISPIQAAAIMLPILVTMDIVGLLSYRRTFDPTILKIMIPGGIAGIFIGYLTAAFVTADHVKLIVGLVAFAFSANYWIARVAKTDNRPPQPHRPVRGFLWASISGFTSFVSHAGGPPYQMYTLPLKIDKRLFAGTSIIFFSVVNAVKLVPYFHLGQFSAQNLATSAVLLPLAPLATLFGVWAVKKVSQESFYQLMYACVALVSLKLIWDGASALFG